MKDPKAIRKAIMTAKSVARLIDPHFGRVPLPELGSFGADKPVLEHSPMVHQAYDEPMPEHFAGGGGVLRAWRNPSPKALRNLTERSTYKADRKSTRLNSSH